MIKQTRLPLLLQLVCLGGMALTASQAFAVDDAKDIVARIGQFRKDSINVDGVGELKLNLSKVTCFDPRGAKLSCETLAGVGYVDKARIKFKGNEMQRIDVLELRQ